MFWHIVLKSHEVAFGYHHGVAAATIVGCILDFLGENVAGVDGTGNVEDADVVIDDGLADFAFAEVNVFHSLICERTAPTDCGLVVIVDVDAVECVGHAEILGAEFDV